MSVNKAVKAVKDGEIEIGDMIITCAVLPDDTRVLSQRGVMKAVGHGRPGGRQWKKRAESGGVNLPVYLQADNLKPFITKELELASSKMYYYIPEDHGGIAHGVDASILPMICDVWLKARDAKVLTAKQIPVAQKADILMRGLARVGIIALIDEATGYQEIRSRKALEKIFEKYIAKELREWTKTFPDEFYKELFRLRAWHFDANNITKRSPYVGKLTNDLVYSRIEYGILEELQKKNPVIRTGYRKHRHHQWLTENIGHPRLREHIAMLIALMRASTKWSNFQRLVNRSLPKKDDTIELLLEVENGEIV
ncbi:MAG: P63C domain-containing protein [Deltaproteobacteria bacterium]|nr:P63C domain-containing protein [Deltaproteobacteria bacterium]